MIVRTWKGKAAKGKEKAYAEHFRNKLMPELKSISGFLGATLLREDRDKDSEFLVLTRWQSMEAVRAFAGVALEHAVMDPEAIAALLSYDPKVQHYAIVDEYLRPTA